MIVKVKRRKDVPQIERFSYSNKTMEFPSDRDIFDIDFKLMTMLGQYFELYKPEPKKKFEANKVEGNK